MKIYKLKNILIAVVVIGIFSSCNKDDEKPQSDSIDLNEANLVGEWIMTNYYQEVDLDWNDGTGSIAKYNGNNYNGSINFDPTGFITSDLTVICVVETTQKGSSTPTIDTESYGSIFDGEKWVISDGKLLIGEDNSVRTFEVKSFTESKLEMEESATVPSQGVGMTGMADVIIQMTFTR